MTLKETIEDFRKLPSAFVTDAMRRIGLSGWSEGVYPISRQTRRIAGHAVTIRYGSKRKDVEKPTSIYQVIREAKPGDVLVFAGRGTSCWLIGENFCHDALYQGLAGFIVDGCVRDADEISEIPLPVFCRGAAIKPWRSHLSIIGINVLVEFAGVQIRQGDIIAGDGDGLAVIPPERAEEVLVQAREIAVLEKEKEEAIKRRAPLEELLQMSAAKRTVKNH